MRSNTSMKCNGHNGNATASIAAGTTNGCSNPTSYASAVPDIYASLAQNITPQCGGAKPGATWTPGSPPSKPGMITINQGANTEYHVCGDLTLSGTGNLTAGSDSLIVIENGSLIMAGNANIGTSQTAIILTGNNSSASAIVFPNGNGHAATLSLSPPITAGNPWQGISLYQDPALTKNVDDTWGPGATFNADGVVYLPNANVTTHGNSASNNSQCTKFVVGTLTTDGSINLNFSQTDSGCSSLGMKQWSDIPVHLVQ